MSNHAVAQRYADALFQLGRAQENLEALDADLDGIAAILKDSTDLGLLWDSPIVSTVDKKAITTQLFEGKIQAATLNTLLLMFDNKRGTSILGLQAAFRERYDVHRKRMTVRVVTALPLGTEQATDLKRELAKATEREIEMETALDPEIIGGIVVTIGDQVIDNSLRGRLEALARTLA